MLASPQKGVESPERHRVLDAFETLYHELNATTVSKERLGQVYAEDLHFQDAFHVIRGLDAFTEYCESLYENVGSICFVFQRRWLEGNDAVLQWAMHFQHPRLKGGKPIEVAGMSFLQLQDDRIVAHRDYFDGGQLLYEHVPLLGTVISQLKKRLA